MSSIEEIIAVTLGGVGNDKPLTEKDMRFWGIFSRDFVAALHAAGYAIVRQTFVIDSVSERVWNAYNTGIVRHTDGMWIDAGMSDAEWLARELGLKGNTPATEVRAALPGLIEAMTAASDQP